MRAAINRLPHAWLVAVVVVAYAAGAATLAWVHTPHSDEGHFTNAAYEFAHHGRLAMPMWTAWIPSLERYVFTNMPLYYVQLGGWISAFGHADLRTVRLNSVLWGVVLVLAWYVILRAVVGDRRAALFGLAILALHYDVMNLTSGRYDVMAAALGVAAVAWYLAWRAERLPLAVLGAGTGLAAAVLTHPFGVFGILGFLCFFVALDRRRVSWPLVLAAAVPFAIGVGAWGLYLAQDLAEAHHQLTINGRGRMANLAQPLQLVLGEIHDRYLRIYAGWRPDVPPLMRIKVLFLLVYVAGVLGCLLTRALRRDPRVLALVAWAGLAFGALAVLDSNHWYIYLVHVIPVFVATLAVWSWRLASRGGLARHAVIAATAVWIAFSAVTVGYRARLDDYERLYRPTLAFLQQHVRDGQLVMAGGEFGPGLEFQRRVADDPKFGFHDGRVADYIVVDKLHAGRMQGWATLEPPLHRHIETTLARYEVVYEKRQPYNHYTVYRRRHP